MTIFDIEKSSSSTPQLFQASFSEHLPTFMQDSFDSSSHSELSDDSSKTPQLSLEENEIKITTAKVKEKTLIEFTELAAEEKDTQLETLLERQDIENVYEYVLNKSKELLESHQPEKAMRYAYSAAHSHPLEIEGYIIYAQALSEMGELEEELSWLDEVKAFFPEDPTPYKYYYYSAKKLKDTKKTHEALLAWLKIDKTNAEAWIEMIEKEKLESIPQALETTNKVLNEHSQDPRILKLKVDLEGITTPVLVDDSTDMDLVQDLTGDDDTNVSIDSRLIKPAQPEYPYLLNPLSGHGIAASDIDLSIVEREIWKRKIQKLAELKQKGSPINLETERRKQQLRESRKRFLNSVKSPSLNFTKPITLPKGKNSLNPRVREIALTCLQKNDELQEKNLSFAKTLQIRSAVSLSRNFHEKAHYFVSEYNKNGLDSFEIINSLARLSSYHTVLKSKFERRYHIIPLQRRSNKDNLLEAVVAGVNLTKKKSSGEIFHFLKLLQRVNNTVSPKICLLARINCEGLKRSKSGNFTVHKFLWKDLQNQGRLPPDPLEVILQTLSREGYKIKTYSKGEGELSIIDGKDPNKTIRLMKTQIGRYNHYDLLYPQLNENIWSDGILLNNALLRNGMNQNEINQSKVCIRLYDGKKFKTHQFDIVPVKGNVNNNFYQAIIAGVNTYHYQINIIRDEIGVILSTLHRILNQSKELNASNLHQATKNLITFVTSIIEGADEYQLEDYSQRFREMNSLIEAFDRGSQELEIKKFHNELLNAMTHLRKFHRVLGNLQSSINRMKMEHDRSFPSNAIVARQDLESLSQINFDDSNTYSWLWEEIQQNGILKSRGSEMRYTSLPFQQVPDAIKTDLANKGFRVVIWVKGSKYFQTSPQKFEFENKYFHHGRKKPKTIHLLASSLPPSSQHYDLLVPVESAALPTTFDTSLKNTPRKRTIEENDDNKDTSNKRQCRRVTSTQNEPSPPRQGDTTEGSLQSQNSIYSRRGRALGQRRNKRQRHIID